MAAFVSTHAVVMGRVAMALVGDAVRAERALEDAAREAARGCPDGQEPLPWLLGLVRAAAATQLSRLPLRRTLDDSQERAPSTERLGAAHAAPARLALSALKPTEREAVVLALVGGLPASDIAVACHVDVETAKARLARGLELLLSTPTSL